MTADGEGMSPEQEQQYSAYVGRKFFKGERARDRAGYRSAVARMSSRRAGGNEWRDGMCVLLGLTEKRGYVKELFVKTPLGNRWQDAANLRESVEFKAGWVGKNRGLEQLAKDAVTIERQKVRVTWYIRDLRLVHKDVQAQMRELALKHPGRFVVREVSTRESDLARQIGREIAREREQVKEFAKGLVRDRDAQREYAQQLTMTEHMLITDQLRRHPERGYGDVLSLHYAERATERLAFREQARATVHEFVKDAQQRLHGTVDREIAELWLEGPERPGGWLAHQPERMGAREIQERTDHELEIHERADKLALALDRWAREADPELAVASLEYVHTKDAHKLTAERGPDGVPKVTVEIERAGLEPVKLEYDSRDRIMAEVAGRVNQGMTPRQAEVLIMQLRGDAWPREAEQLREVQDFHRERELWLELNPELRMRRDRDRDAPGRNRERER